MQKGGRRHCSVNCRHGVEGTKGLKDITLLGDTERESGQQGGEEARHSQQAWPRVTTPLPAKRLGNLVG